ncbi:MAG TPA: response regulator [Bryobacteraceae bacterium]|nr:response regulator [Bryobacteraceae bacterium]
MTQNPVELLLVEDNLSDVELTVHVLKKHGLANSIEIARDGAEALELLLGDGRGRSARPVSLPRLILLDLKLPKVNGLEVLAKLKADARTKSIPVVVLTSSREDQDLFLCYELGANSYIVKPVDFGRFTEAVRQLSLYWLLLNEKAHGHATSQT